MSHSSDISATQLDALRTMAKTYRPGDLICLEGEPTQDLMFLISGVVEILQANAVLKTISGRQMFLGHISFFSSKRRTATLRAKTSCEVVKIREDRIENLLSKVPSLAMRLMRDVTQLFVEKDEELARYKKGALTRRSPEASAMEKMAYDFMPVVLVALMSNVKLPARIELVTTLLDALGPRLDLSRMVLGPSTIANVVEGPEARAALEAAVRDLVREKSERHDDDGDYNEYAGVSDDDMKAAIKASADSTARLRKAVGALVEQRSSLGAENALKLLRKKIAEMASAINSHNMTKLVELAASSLEYFDRIEGADQYRRATDRYRKMVNVGKKACDNILAESDKLRDISASATQRQELLEKLRFAI